MRFAAVAGCSEEARRSSTSTTPRCTQRALCQTSFHGKTKLMGVFHRGHGNSPSPALQPEQAQAAWRAMPASRSKQQPAAQFGLRYWPDGQRGHNWSSSSLRYQCGSSPCRRLQLGLKNVRVLTRPDALQNYSHDASFENRSLADMWCPRAIGLVLFDFPATCRAALRPAPTFPAAVLRLNRCVAKFQRPPPSSANHARAVNRINSCESHARAFGEGRQCSSQSLVDVSEARSALSGADIPEGLSRKRIRKRFRSAIRRSRPGRQAKCLLGYFNQRRERAMLFRCS